MRILKPRRQQPKPTTDQRLDQIIALIKRMEAKMTEQLESLVQEVAAYGTVTASAIALVDGMAARIDELVRTAGSGGIEPQRLTDLATELRAQHNALADAVTRNTPAQSGEPSSGEGTPA